MWYEELEMFPNLPCLSCPLLTFRIKDQVKIPFCLVYSENTVGLESCKEIATYITMYGNKEKFLDHVKKQTVITF